MDQQQQQQQELLLLQDKSIQHAFQHVLPPDRLGEELSSLELFYVKTKHLSSLVKEFCIIVVTDMMNDDKNSNNEQTRRILLGMKHRGFGQNMYNAFAGKKESFETSTECACRELEEEAGIAVPAPVMHDCRVGAMHFTFEDSAVEMIAHVFHVDVNTSPTTCTTTTTDVDDETVTTATSTTTDSSSTADKNTCHSIEPFPIDPNCIRGCEEITPQWFEDCFNDLPLQNMFADDSLWLTKLLQSFAAQRQRLLIDGWFHYLAGGQDANSIRHYYMDVRPKPQQQHSNRTNMATTPSHKFSSEKRLVHALKSNKNQSPSIKEFNDGWAADGSNKKYNSTDGRSNDNNPPPTATAILPRLMASYGLCLLVGFATGFWVASNTSCRVKR